MASFTNEMTRVKDEIESLSDSRYAFLRGLREEVNEGRKDAADMIDKFKSDRAARSGADKEDRRTFASNMKMDVAEMIEFFRKERAETASETKIKLDAFISEISGFVSDLKNDVQDMIAELHEERVEKSNKTKEKLDAFASDLKTDVENLLEEFEGDRVALSAHTKHMLQNCVSGTRKFVSDLKKDVNSAQKALSELRKQNTEAERRERERFISDLTGRVSAFRKNIQEVRNSFAEDLAGARQVWQGASHSHNAVLESEDLEEPVETKIEDSESAEELQTEGSRTAPEEIDKKEESEESPAENFVPDDLTIIPGVGAGRERMLNEAGIYTFAQIAESSPEKLRSALGEMSRVAPVEKWIESAKRLSPGEKQAEEDQ